MSNKDSKYIRYHGMGTFKPLLYGDYKEFQQDVQEVEDKSEGVKINHEIGHTYKKDGKVHAGIVFDIMVDKIRPDPDSDVEEVRKNLESSLKGKVELLRMD